MSSKPVEPSSPPPQEPVIPVAVREGSPQVYVAISDVIGDMGREGISKAHKNEQQKYMFRGIDDLYNALSSVLAARKLIIMPRVVANRVELRETKSGTQMYHVYVEVEYDIISGADGSKHTARYPGEALDSSDKATNKAMTAAFKYLCFQLFCIPLEGMDDADATTHETRAPQKPVAKPEPDQSPQEFVDLIEVAPNMDALKAVFRSAWTGYAEADFRAKFQKAYDKRKVELSENGE